MDALFPTPIPPVFSFWEIERHFAAIDLLVVGGGLVGLTTALFCKEQAPKMRILVLEKGPLPSGASTKNAGFACFGSLSELLEDIDQQPMDMVFQRVEDRINGLSLLRSLLHDRAIGYEPCGGHELFTRAQRGLAEACLDLLPEANRRLATITGTPDTYRHSATGGTRHGMRGVEQVVVNTAEGAIDTGRMMQALTNRVRTAGVDVITGLGVSSVQEVGGRVAVHLNNGVGLRVGRVHVATNGFAKELLPELDARPARAQVLITEPVAGLQVKGTFHIDAGYYYFRNVGDRLLLGGGRNLDKMGETTTATGLSPLIQEKLEELLREVILPDTPHRIAHRWSGVMGIGSTRDTIIKEVSDRVTCSVRLGGMGVALGSLVGQRSARMILGAQR